MFKALQNLLASLAPAERKRLTTLTTPEATT